MIDDSIEFETVFINDEISRCEDVDDLKKQVFPLLQSQKGQWAKKIKSIIAEKGLNNSKFSNLCGYSKVAVGKWCKGAIPNKRETFLKIGMAAGYNREEIDSLLQRYARRPKTYVKNLEDCICIYCLDHDYGDKIVEKYDYILNKIKEKILENESSTQDFDTVLFDEKLSDIKSEEELEEFISENITIFSSAFNKFYAYVKMHIVANYDEFNGSVYELAQGQGWSSSLRQSVSAIYQKKWYPTRNKIISLGLHLSMDLDQINEMLELAYMGPLYAKNIFESIIIFILEDASLNNILDEEHDEYDPDGLFRYAADVMGQIDFPEVEAFINELTEMNDETV